jgi:2,3-bisphosphoglycerate-independent phosphoglycerate mutase
VRTHTSDPIPYLLYDSTKKLGDNAGYSEAVGKENGILKEDGYKLMEYLLND